MNKTQEINSNALSRERILLLLQSEGYPLPVQKNKINPFMFTLQEIQEKKNYHQQKADIFQKLWNDEIGDQDAALWLYDPQTKMGTSTIIDTHSWKVQKMLKDFIYDLCMFHVNERIKWDLELSKLIKKDPETIGKILKP